MKLISSLNELVCYAKHKAISKYRLLLFAVLCLKTIDSTAQTHLEIERKKLFGTRTATVNAFETITIKTKANEKLKNLVITGFSDSAFIFKDHKPLKFSELQRITLVGERPICNLFGKFFKRFGIAFFALNTINQAITGNSPVFEAQALYIGGSIYAFGVVLRSFENKRIRVGSETKFTTIEIKFSEIN